MAATILLYDPLRVSTTARWVLHGTAQTPWAGTGTPWETDYANTPMRIANNDVTGPRFVLTADPGSPVLDGGPPFNDWPGAAMLTRGNRTITIPLSLAATSADNLTLLLGAFRTYLNRMVAGGQGTLWVQYPEQSDGGTGITTGLGIIHAAFQETDTFWNDEDGTGRMRGSLTLLCSVGTGFVTSSDEGAGTVTNAVAGTSALPATLRGDRLGTGQPMTLDLTGGGIASAGTKIVFVSTVAGVATSGTLSSSLSTSSLSALVATGSVTIIPTRHQRTAVRWLAEVTTPSVNLSIRIRVRYNSSSGQVVYTGPWFTGSGATTIFDLGYLPSPQASALPGADNVLYAELQYRSIGGAASGTLTVLRALEYYTFCRIAAPSATSANDYLSMTTAMPNGVTNWHANASAVIRNSSSVITQTCEVRGMLPLCYADMSLFVAWMNNGTFTSGSTTTATMTNYPLYETIGAVTP